MSCRQARSPLVFKFQQSGLRPAGLRPVFQGAFLVYIKYVRKFVFLPCDKQRVITVQLQQPVFAIFACEKLWLSMMPSLKTSLSVGAIRERKINLWTCVATFLFKWWITRRPFDSITRREAAAGCCSPSVATQGTPVQKQLNANQRCKCILRARASLIPQGKTKWSYKLHI